MFFRSKKAPKIARTEHEYVEFTGNNDTLLSVVNVGSNMDKLDTVIVPPTHVGIVIKNGVIESVYESGEYALYDANGKLKPKEAVRTLKVVYISRTARLDIQWGTQLQQRIEYIDPIIKKPVSVGAFGYAEIKIADPKKFYLELVASYGDEYTITALKERMRSRVVDELLRLVSSVVSSRKISYIELNASKFDIQEDVANRLASKLIESYGLQICDFVIDNLNVTKEQAEEIKSAYEDNSEFERNKRRFELNEEMKALEREARRRDFIAQKEDSELEDFVYTRQRDRMREEQNYERTIRHEEEDRAWAREDARDDREERMHGKYMDTVRDIEESKSKAEVAAAEKRVTKGIGHHCPICGAAYKPGVNYCPDCGAIIPNETAMVACAVCGLESPWGTSFCPSCGTPLTGRREKR